MRPVTLNLTARGNKKLCFHFKSPRVPAHTQVTLQWSEKLQDTTLSNFTSTGPDCCTLLKQLPQGTQRNLVYTSLSTYSSDLAQVITTSLSPPKFSPKECYRKDAAFGFVLCRFGIDQNKRSISMPGHLLDRRMFALQVSQPAHPEHISHTNTHLPRSAEPLHHQKWPVSLSP